MAGTMRWQSPERLAGSVPTWQCDVYAFAMAVFEVSPSRGASVYSHCRSLRDKCRSVTSMTIPSRPVLSVRLQSSHRGLVLIDIEGKRPGRPASIPDALWTLATKCWAQNPSERPTFEVIVKQMSAMYDASRSADRQGSHLTGKQSEISLADADMYPSFYGVESDQHIHDRQ